MRTCKACGGELAEKAWKCQKCGVDQRQWAARHPFLTGLFGLFIIGMIGSVISGTKEGSRRSNLSPEQRAAEDRHKTARGACILALEKTLHDPKSAEMGISSAWFIEDRPDGTILVQPTVRAKNAMGAFINATWDCVVKPEGEMVKVVSLEQIRP